MQSESAPLKMYLMESNGRRFIAFGQDCMQAAQEVVDKYGVKTDSISVGISRVVGKIASFEYEVPQYATYAYLLPEPK